MARESSVAQSSQNVRAIKKNNQVTVFEKTLQKSKVWVKEVQREIKFCKPNEAYHILRATLQAIRDQLSIHEAAQLSAQLPLLLRGVYFECWNPATKPHRVKGLDRFLLIVEKNLGPKTKLKFEIRDGVRAVFKVLMDHVSDGEMHDVVNALSPSLRNFLLEIKVPEVLN